jgi:hypothetical protein
MSDIEINAPKKMEITKASSDGTFVAVEWHSVSYKDCTGYVLGIVTGSTRLDNFPVDNPKATSAQVTFACIEGTSYTVFVEPVIKGVATDRLCSTVTPIVFQKRLTP